MQRQSRKNAIEAEAAVPSSPYRQGSWTVTMLKDELRNRQLPITGKKSDLIDRLESSPLKTAAAPNSARKQPALSAAILEKRSDSPVASRGRSASPSLRMLTRSRSTSLTRGTFLTWTQNPLAVASNFAMASVEFAARHAQIFAVVAVVLLSFAAAVYFNVRLQTALTAQFARFQPVLSVFTNSLVASLGLANTHNSAFSKYISRASRFMYDCAAGNIERNVSTGRLRCSAAPLQLLGLPGKLVWLTREQVFAWIAGTATASLIAFSVASKARTAMSFWATNKTAHKALQVSTRFAPVTAVLPFELVGFIAGFSGLSSSTFAKLLVIRTVLSAPLFFASKALYAKHAAFISAQVNQIPNAERIITAFTQFTQSIFLIRARQSINFAIYLVICAAAIQVIANTRLYKSIRSSNANKKL
jgi:hypothetical protein